MQNKERKATMMGNLLTLVTSKEYMDNEYIAFNATRDYIAKECYLCEREFEDLEHKRAFNLDSPEDVPSNIFIGAWCEDCFQEFDLFSRTLHSMN
tara:strand:- start:225 stop:509 length:285 start_codon:yes stop_codon:yes gene_type:complete